jgi:hypothetical protein
VLLNWQDRSVHGFSRELGECCSEGLGCWLQAGDYIATTSKISVPGGMGSRAPPDHFDTLVLDVLFAGPDTLNTQFWGPSSVVKIEHATILS